VFAALVCKAPVTDGFVDPPTDVWSGWPAGTTVVLVSVVGVPFNVVVMAIYEVRDWDVSVEVIEGNVDVAWVVVVDVGPLVELDPELEESDDVCETVGELLSELVEVGGVVEVVELVVPVELSEVGWDVEVVLCCDTVVEVLLVISDVNVEVVVEVEVVEVVVVPLAEVSCLLARAASELCGWTPSL